MTAGSPIFSRGIVTSFWQRHGGLAFFGPALILVGFLGLSTAAQRWLIYLVLAAFLYKQGRQFIPFACKQSHILQVACLFILYSLFSLFWQDTIDPKEALKTLRTSLVIFLFVMFMAWAAYSTDQENPTMQRAFHLFCAAAAIVAVGAILVYAYDGFSLARRLGIYGITANPIKAATVFAVVIVTLLLWRRYYLAAVGLPGFAIWMVPVICLFLLTFSRGPLIAVSLITLLILALTGRGKWALLLGGLAFVALLLVLGGFLDQIDLIKRGDSHRFAIWADALEKVSARPYFGWGIKDNSKFAAAAGWTGWKSPHNIYLSALFYGGIIGLGLFVGTLAMALKTALKLFKSSDLARLSLALICLGLVIGCFNMRTVMVNAQPVWLVYWLPVGLLIGLELKDKIAGQRDGLDIAS